MKKNRKLWRKLAAKRGISQIQDPQQGERDEKAANGGSMKAIRGGAFNHWYAKRAHYDALSYGHTH